MRVDWTDAKQMRCGNCGEPEHYIYSKDDYLIAVCIKCDSKSFVTVSVPKIKIEWEDSSDGILCVF